MTQSNFVKVLVARNGRYAVLARMDESARWVQVGCTLGRDQADEHATELAYDPDFRNEEVENNAADAGPGAWGEDSPVEWPSAA